MKRVLFVCLGNICRSAIAEGVLRSKVEIKDLNIIVDSAGTSSYHIGEAPDKRMQHKAKEYGLDISTQKARQFNTRDFDNFDFIFAMDNSNFRDISALARSKDDMKKVELFLNLLYQNENMDVPDPYYGGSQGFEDVYQMVDKACDLFLEKLENE